MASHTAFIFARGGSKGVPGKNIRLLAGKPLIGWAIHHALAAETINRVIVSTDCEEIAHVAAAHGAEVPFLRPSELAQDDTPEILAWRHALQFLAQEQGELPPVFVSVPTTAPLRRSEDIDNCVIEHVRTQADLTLTVTPSSRNPWFNMVAQDDVGNWSLLSKDRLGRPVHRRQDAPAAFDVTTVAYAARPQHLLIHDTIMSGKISATIVPAERSLDIDTCLDFSIAEFLLSHQGMST